MTPSLSPRLRSERPHVPALDGVRGLAILMVLAHHLIYVNQEPRTLVYVWSRAVVGSLWCGVDIFFALSGFLITGILLKSTSGPHFFRNFYARRALRIFPLYYAVLLCLFLCTHWLHILWGGQQWRLLTYSNHLWIETHATGWNFYFGGLVNLVDFWSLHVEEQFYLVWPVLVFFVRSPIRLLGLALGLSGVSLGLRLWLALHGMSHEVLYATILTRADGLLIGAALALLLETRFRAAALRWSRPVLWVSLLMLGIIFVVRQGLLWRNDPSLWGNHVIFSVQFTLVALAATALIGTSLNPAGLAARMLRTRPMRFFGKYSYGLYIFHFVLPIFLLPVLTRLLAPIAEHAMLVHLLITATELAVSILVAVLSFRYFEQPFLVLKRFFKERRVQPSATAKHLQTVAIT